MSALSDKIEMISVWDHSRSPERHLIARFWYSAARGLTCDEPLIAADLAERGLVVPYEMIEPDTWKIVHPDEPRLFFDVLPYHYSGSYVRAERPVEVAAQGGEPFG